MEMAYPGIGILAGDSLQYLSIVTAHGVIMVFFMIIPLLYGAFSNFLIPTQLGVHDVAFPRLNSAAFWFLPAGLIMLGQMVCIDRRYQRMNCFNVREYESLLRRRFFFDLVNTSDYRDLMDKTIINLRYKQHSSDLFTHSSHLFGNLGLKTTTQSRLVNYLNPHTYTNLQSYLINYLPLSLSSLLTPLYSLLPTIFDLNPVRFNLVDLNGVLHLFNFSSLLNGFASRVSSFLTVLVPRVLTLEFVAMGHYLLKVLPGKSNYTRGVEFLNPLQGSKRSGESTFEVITTMIVPNTWAGLVGVFHQPLFVATLFVQRLATLNCLDAWSAL
jgi:hypothetical protein